jgi:hypothetical protein
MRWGDFRGSPQRTTLAFEFEAIILINPYCEHFYHGRQTSFFHDFRDTATLVYTEGGC